MRTRIGSRLSLVVSAGLLLPGLAGVASASPRAGAYSRVPTRGYSSQLAEVSCSPARQCWAVGSYTTKHGLTFNEALRWTGQQWAWATVPLPRGQSGLSGISCPSARDCLAVGFTANARGRQGQAEVLRWDGSTWSVTSAPAGMLALRAISCDPSGSCWAFDPAESLAAHWDGHEWAKPIPTSPLDSLSGLTCLSATNCWAAGFYVKPNSINLYNLVMRWNGQVWSAVRVPQPKGGGNKLNAITCLSATDCWAGGSRTLASQRSANELLHWDGSTWSLVAVPRGPLVNSEVLALACPATQDCWATGDDEGAPQALRWDGSHWSLVPTPDPGGAGFLYSVSCLNTTDCLAAGFSHVPPVQNLALRWNGTAWVVV